MVEGKIRRIYTFINGKSDGNKKMKELVGLMGLRDSGLTDTALQQLPEDSIPGLLASMLKLSRTSHPSNLKNRFYIRTLSNVMPPPYDHKYDQRHSYEKPSTIWVKRMAKARASSEIWFIVRHQISNQIAFYHAMQLGGKGANLCEMARDGLNVPPGLTITTEVCQEFYKCGK